MAKPKPKPKRDRKRDEQAAIRDAEESKRRWALDEERKRRWGLINDALELAQNEQMGRRSDTIIGDAIINDGMDSINVDGFTLGIDGNIQKQTFEWVVPRTTDGDILSLGSEVEAWRVNSDIRQELWASLDEIMPKQVSAKRALQEQTQDRLIRINAIAPAVDEARKLIEIIKRKPSPNPNGYNFELRPIQPDHVHAIDSTDRLFNSQQHYINQLHATIDQLKAEKQAALDELVALKSTFETLTSGRSRARRPLDE